MRTRLAPALVVLMSLILPAGLLAPACAAESTSKKKAPDASGSQTQPIAKAKPQTRPATPAKPQTRPGSKDSGPLSFTNEDLKSNGEAATTSPNRQTGPAATQADPLKAFRDREERSRWRREKAAGMEKQVTDLEERLKFLERKRLSIVNPLVGRPTEPGAAEPRDEDKGLSGPELLERTDAEIRQTTQDLEQARRALAEFLAANPE